MAGPSGDRMTNGNTFKAPFEIGNVVAGRYRIDRHLAEGGMGVVVAATHLNLEQSVALKFLRGDIRVELDGLARFTREAKAAAQLRSEYVARVLDAGLTDDGTPFMAMEYLEGENLARTLQLHGPLDIAHAVEYVVQACEGLAEAHSQGIIHRDIKPDNLFLVDRTPGWNAVKILDFGISKFAFSSASNIATGVIFGSPCYMSPEHLRSTATVDHRTDLWSLGATLYELLVGRAAFDASQTLPEIITAILDKPAPRVRDARADIPAALAAVIDRCMAKDRDERFESAGALAAALLRFAPDRARIPAERAASMRPVVWSDPGASSVRPPSVGTPVSFVSATSGPEHAIRSSRQAPASLSPMSRTDEPDEIDRSKINVRRLPLAARRWLSIAGGAAAATLALVVARSAADGRSKPPVDLQVVTSAPKNASTEVPPTATVERLAAEPERVEFSVRASPPYARITIDDKPVSNPFKASYPKGGRTHRVFARAWGYEMKSTEVTLTADTVVELGLERHAHSEDPPRAVKAHPAAESTAPSSTATTPMAIAVTAGQDLDPAGGRVPLRPIEVQDPYGGP